MRRFLNLLISFGFMFSLNARSEGILVSPSTTNVRYQSWVQKWSSASPVGPELQLQRQHLVEDFGEFLTEIEFPAEVGLVIDDGPHPLYESAADLMFALKPDERLIVFPSPQSFVVMLSMLAADEHRPGFVLRAADISQDSGSDHFGASGLNFDSIESTLVHFLKNVAKIDKNYIIRVPVTYLGAKGVEDEGTRFFLVHLPRLLRYYDVKNVRLLFEASKSDWTRAMRVPLLSEEFDHLQKIRALVTFDAGKLWAGRSCAEVLLKYN